MRSSPCSICIQTSLWRVLLLTCDRFRKEIWDTLGKEMGLPSRAVEDAIWSMGPDEIAQRANHQPFLLEKGTYRQSRSPSSATAFQSGRTPTPTTPGGVGKVGEEPGGRRGRASSTAGRRSRTQSNSMVAKSGVFLPPLQEGSGDAGKRSLKSDEEGSEHESTRGGERERREWFGQVATTAESPVMRTASHYGQATRA